MADEKEKTGEETTSQYTLRLPDVLREQLEAIAGKEDRSLSKQIISILRKFCEDYGKEKAQS